jgi:hypothetical protein
MTTEEFYIGYLPKAPSRLGFFLKVVIGLIGIAVMVLGWNLAKHQKGFSTSNFEYGKITSIEGVLVTTPIPMLKVNMGTDLFGKPVIQTLPMVGFGKMGAQSVINSLENKAVGNLAGKIVKLNGTLIYGDGKALLQIAEEDNADLSSIIVANNHEGSSSSIEDLGEVNMKGEILDPKCYFGVMKPGEGKPHKSCAIRCISGGITPVLVTRSTSGETKYYWLLGEKGQSVNQEILQHVAEPVEIKGRLKKSDDIEFLYAAPADIRKI